MNFWDSSALIPLIIQEPSSPRILELRESSENILAWTLTPIEVLSTLCRLERMNALSSIEFRRAIGEWQRLRKGISLVREVELVKSRAERIIRIHTLKAADVLQLAAAIAICDDPSQCRFVTLDLPLARAASLEGFNVLPNV